MNEWGECNDTKKYCYQLADLLSVIEQRDNTILELIKDNCLVPCTKDNFMNDSYCDGCLVKENSIKGDK